MSYSIGLRAANREAAKAELAKRFDQMLVTSPEHAKDRDAVLASVDTMLAVLPDDETTEFRLTVNGSLSMRGATRETAALVGVHLNISAMLVPVQPAEGVTPPAPAAGNSEN
jgi:ornithine cyclodeaminase/alanine dehydrogenase-like protein (mu-crystallin family)